MSAQVSLTLPRVLLCWWVEQCSSDAGDDHVYLAIARFQTEEMIHPLPDTQRQGCYNNLKNKLWAFARDRINVSSIITTSVPFTNNIFVDFIIIWWPCSSTACSVPPLKSISASIGASVYSQSVPFHLNGMIVTAQSWFHCLKVIQGHQVNTFMKNRIIMMMLSNCERKGSFSNS